MLTHQRQQKILEIISKSSAVHISELSDSIGVSEATIRRDLDKLHELGLVRRIHGGAISASRSDPEPPVIQRSEEHREEKERIGKAAAALIQDGETVFIGSGTTTLEIARNLAYRKGITVITNALTVINALAQENGISIIAVGGLFRQSELSFVGYISEQALRELRPSKVIMGIRAISLEEGLTNDFLPEVSTDRVIIRSAPKIILVADHSKFGKISTAFVAPIESVSTIVTDSQTPLETVEALRALGIEVICA